MISERSGRAEFLYRGEDMKTTGRRAKRIFAIVTGIVLLAGSAAFAGNAGMRAAAITQDIKGPNLVDYRDVSSWEGMKRLVDTNLMHDVKIRLTSDLTVTSGNLHNTSHDVEIDLNGYTINANNQQAFWNEKGTLIIKNGTIKNGVSDLGGAINNRGTLVLENVTIKNCKAKQGGGILNYGTLTMTGGGIINCQAGRGGGIRLLPHDSDKSAIAQSATATLTNVKISGNTADGSSSYGRGGGIGVSNGTLTMTGCTVTGNRSTDDDGGGIDFDAKSRTLTLKDTAIENNYITKSERQGGGINLERGDASIRNCTISGNSAPDGGGINISDAFGTATIYSTTIKNNESTAYGGGGICNHGTVSIEENSVISGNTSKAGGAGIWTSRSLKVSGSTVSGNRCKNSDADGGGICVAAGIAQLDSVTVSDNSASDGGGINVTALGQASVCGSSEISGNTVNNSGGGIMNKGSLALWDNVTITGNSCGANGGGIYHNGSLLKLRGKIRIRDNNDNNLFVFTGKVINVNGKIDNSSEIYVTTGNGTQTFTSGFESNVNSNVGVFVHDYHQKIIKYNGEARVVFETVSGDIFDGVTVRIHPADHNSALNIRDNGRGPGQNVVQLFNTGDSCRLYLTKADENSYYIDYFDGADDYSPSTKRFDLSDKGGYGNSGNVVHVVKGNRTATNKRWMFIRNSDGTYYVQNKRSGLYWDLENNNYDNKNKLCQRAMQSAQKWEIEIVAADGNNSINDVKPYDSYSFTSGKKQVTASNWMSCLPDDLYITDLSIPGTHDSGTAHTATCNSSAQCQQLSIHDQMYSGIRYFDLRIGPDMRIVHGPTNCQFNGDGLYLDRVMNWIREFLRNNPGETIILQPMENRGGDKVDKAAYRYFKTLVEIERDLFYVGDHVPTLKECRGKIVIISRLDYSNNDYKTSGGQWALDARNWQTSRIDHNYYDDEEYLNRFDFRYETYSNTDKIASGQVAAGSNYEIWSQDDYKKVGDSKWEVIWNSIFDNQTGAQARYNWYGRAKQNKNLWLVAYTSCTSMAAPVKYPQNAARELNPKVKNEIMKQTSMDNGKFLGVVCTDFADEQMAYLIYRQNFAMSHVIIHGVTVDGKEPFLPLVYNVAKNQPLNETLGLKKDEIDTYFTRSNYATHDYSYRESTDSLCSVPMSQLKSEEEYRAARVDISKLRGDHVYELYLGLDTKMNTTQNVLFEAPDCLTEVSGVNGKDLSGQTPRPKFKEAENAHYHIAEENGAPKAYWVVRNPDEDKWWYTDDGQPEGFTGKLESGKEYSASAELEADWGYCFSTDITSVNFHITSSDGKTEDTSTSAGWTLFPYNIKVKFHRAAISHELTHEEAKAATCTAAGNVENYYCKLCDRYFADEACTVELSEEERVLAAQGHKPQDPKEENRKEPTCTEDGSVDIVSRCSICGEIVSSQHQILPATGHAWRAWTADAEAGTERRVCSNDHSHIQTRSILDADHVHHLVKKNAAAATCEKDGNTEYWVCSGEDDSCGRYYADSNGTKEIDPEDTVIKALGHEWDEGKVRTAPTCTEQGVIYYTCMHDSSHTKEESIPALGHKAGEWVDEVVHEASCMHPQYKWHTLYCGNGCGEILTAQLRTGEGKLEHKWSEPEYVWSDDYSKVTAKRVCTCDADNPHEETETAEVSSIEQDGKVHLTAEFTNKAFEKQAMDRALPAGEDVWDEGVITKEPTCTEDGEILFTCKYYKTLTRTEIIKARHNPGTHVVKYTDTATCTKGGTQTVETVCLVCGEVLKTEKEATPPLGHNWGPEEYNISMSNGQKFMTASHTCLDCGETETETVGVVTEDDVYYSDAFENVFFEMQEWALGEGDGDPEDYWVHWAKGSSGDALFGMYQFLEEDALSNIIQFKAIQIDGEEVPASEYTYKSTFIEDVEAFDHTVSIKPSYMEGLYVGTHMITAVYRQGGEEKTVSEYFIVDPESADAEEHTHSLTHVPSKNATCTEDGNIEYWVCDQGEKSCGKYFADEGCTIEIEKEDTHIEAAGHAWDEWVVDKEATETEDGLETRICMNDETHKESRVIPGADEGVTYRNTAGDGQRWTKGSGNTADFTFKRSVEDSETFSHFKGILVDGNDVDASYYTAEPGSVIISLKPSYLETLSEGKHTLTAVFDDGNDPEAAFTILAANNSSGKDEGDSGSSKTKSARTGDENQLILWMALLMAAAAELAVTGLISRRKKGK